MRTIRRFLWRFRIDICLNESDGFDVGCFAASWKRSRGPFLLYRYGECGRSGHWRLMVACTPAAWVGFDDGVTT